MKGSYFMKNPIDFETTVRVKTPRGTFTLVKMTMGEMLEAGFGYHHSSDNGSYCIVTNGMIAYAVCR